MEHTTVPQICRNILLPLDAARPHDLDGSSPAQFVLLISHSRKNVMQCKEFTLVNCPLSKANGFPVSNYMLYQSSQ